MLVFGNGGSATQSSHFAAELVNKFYFRRRALPVLALSADMANVTSIANDEEFRFVFSRQVEAFAARGDVALGITTSGRSANVLQALAAARERGMLTIALAGSQVEELRADPGGHRWSPWMPRTRRRSRKCTCFCCMSWPKRSKRNYLEENMVELSERGSKP